jgi:hypothetical protein
MNEQELEQEIQEKGLNAPRITPEKIDAKIVGVAFFLFPESQTTVCNLTLENGFTVVGESACASPENFDAALGQKIAHDNARDKIRVLEVYLLKQKLYKEASGTYLDRLLEEVSELEEKTKKLSLFIDSDKFETLEYAQRNLLITQLKYMVGYGHTLHQRTDLEKV